MHEPTPELFVDAAFSYQRTAAIQAAISLDLFTAICSGADSVKELAAQTEASPRGIRILCDYLTVQGFLEKAGDRYRPTPSTQMFLNSKSPTYLGGVTEFMASPELIRVFLDDPASYVRRGGALGLSTLAPDHPIWVTFAKAMAPFVAPVAEAIAEEVGSWPTKPHKVLDIAAGHGAFESPLAGRWSRQRLLLSIGTRCHLGSRQCQSGWPIQPLQDYSWERLRR